MKDPSGEQKTLCGTPNYISPYNSTYFREIVSRLPYGLASDVWALGCMMVTLLTGTPPFESVAVKSTLEKVSRVEYSIPPTVSNQAKDLISKLLQKVFNSLKFRILKAEYVFQMLCSIRFLIPDFLSGQSQS